MRESGDPAVISYKGAVGHFEEPQIHLDRGLALKKGVHVTAFVTSISDSTFALAIGIGKQATKYKHFSLETEIELGVILNGRLQDMASFVHGDGCSVEAYPQMLAEYVILKEGSVSFMRGGDVLIMNLKLRGYEEEVRVDREDTLKYFIYDK